MDKREKKALMAQLERDAQRICARFRLRYRVLEPERANVKSRYGVCFSDGTIRIRLNHATTKRPLKYSSLVNTLCHELAHLRHFNHGPRFQAFYAQILEWARREGIYRPGPERRPTRDRGVQGRRPAGASAPSFAAGRPAPARGEAAVGRPGRARGEAAVGSPAPVAAANATQARPSAKAPESPRTRRKKQPDPSRQLELFG